MKIACKTKDEYGVVKDMAGSNKQYLEHQQTPHQDDQSNAADNTPSK